MLHQCSFRMRTPKNSITRSVMSTVRIVDITLRVMVFGIPSRLAGTLALVIFAGFATPAGMVNSSTGISGPIRV